jgi:tRNA A-37 threonylcarbamoyl transferase component Bud32
MELETVTDWGKSPDALGLGDLDGDGNDEVIQWTGRHLSASRIRGSDDALTLSSLLDESSDPSEALSAGLVQILDTRRQLLAVSVMRGSRSFCKVASLEPGDRVSWVELPPYDAVNWLHKGGGPIDQSALMPFALVQRRDGDMLLAHVRTGYFPRPRAVVAYAWPSGRLLWSHQMGPIPVTWSIGDCDGDSTPELFVGTYSPGNGDEAEGTGDSLCWVMGYRLDAVGTELWPPRCVGGLHCGAHVLLAQPELDGTRPLIVAINNAAGADASPGSMSVLRSSTGELLHTAFWSADIADLVGLMDVDGYPGVGFDPGGRILAATADGRLLLVNPELSIVSSVKASTVSCTFRGTLALGRKKRGHVPTGLLVTTASELLVFDGHLRTMARAELSRAEEFPGFPVRRAGRANLIATRQDDDLRFLRIRRRSPIELLAAGVRGVLRGPAVILVPAIVAVLLAVTLQLLKLRRRVILGMGDVEPHVQDRRLSRLLTNDSIGIALPIWEHASNDREAMLVRACGSDSRLRARVERALQSLDECSDALSASADQEHTYPPTIGRYPIVGVLGRGGMSTVYLADDGVLKRRVAIKALPKQPLGRMEADTIRREAELIARVTHRNLPVVYAFESDGQLPYIVMEHIPGIDLRRRLLRGRLPMEAVVLICLQIAGALEAAHAAGIVHRDLKPSNVMITPEGTIKVLDLGLAQLVDETGHGSALRGVLDGTLGYMSPEQIRGEPVDCRMDMWGFGCVAFECASGVPAFSSDWGLAGSFTEPDWGALPAETPPALRRLIRSCLALNPRERPSSMTGIGRTLEALLRSVFVILPWTAVAVNMPRLRRHRRDSEPLVGQAADGRDSGCP